MKVTLTPIEKLFLSASQDLIEDIESQVWIERYRVDFFVRRKRLIIELDGHNYHKTKEQRTKDAKRQRFLERKGYRVIRFTGTEIYKDATKCVRETIDFLNTLSDSTEKSFDSNVRYCPRRQDTITHLSSKYGFDLNSSSDGYLTLKLGQQFLPLSIEKHENLVEVMHWFTLNEDIAFDPSIQFLMVSSPLDELIEWTPVSITQFARAFMGFKEYQECIVTSDYYEGQEIEIFDLEVHNDIANFQRTGLEL